MRLRHNFTTNTRELVRDIQWTCGECGGNGQGKGGISLHHICSRISSSPLGAIPLCGFCHSKVGHGEEERIKYLTKTLIYLRSQHYKFMPADHAFICSNYLLFKKVLEQ